jgi:hypothetical protein
MKENLTGFHMCFKLLMYVCKYFDENFTFDEILPVLSS